MLDFHDIHVINMVRDGRNVVASLKRDWNWYNPFEWMECINQSQVHDADIDMTIRYEDLLTNPDQIQQRIVEYFEMKRAYHFSKYPNFIKVPENRKDNYKYRPLDKTKTAPDLKTYLQRPNDIEFFTDLLSQLGYDGNPDK